jgi:hypothetical protein
MLSPELITLLNVIGGVPLHSILFFAIAVLWRKVNKLEADLLDCLKQGEQEKRLQEFIFTKKK